MNREARRLGVLGHLLTWGSIIAGVVLVVYFATSSADAAPFGIGLGAASTAYGVGRLVLSRSNDGVKLHQRTIIPATAIGLLAGILAAIAT